MGQFESACSADGTAFVRRHLCLSEKRAIVSRFSAVRQNLQTPGYDSGERGFPDLAILPWCDRLNAIPGVCTLQSCAGHLRKDGTYISGELWLWLRPTVARAFHARAFELARLSPPIEQVRTIYARWGQEVAAVTFAGNERNRLTESMELIVAFVSDL